MTTKGKRLSPAQRRVLELLTADGATLERWHGMKTNAFVRIPGGEIVDVRDTAAFPLSRTDLLKVVDSDWRRTIYKLSDAGRAALAPAGTTSEPHGEPPAPAALTVTDEPGQGSGSGSMAAGLSGDQATS